MRRLDVLTLGLLLLLAGGGAYGLFRAFGFDPLDAGVWAQAVLVVGLVGWLLTYLFRAATRQMTYFQQVEDYKQAVLEKRLESLSPEALAALQAEIEADKDRDRSGADRRDRPTTAPDGDRAPSP